MKTTYFVPDTMEFVPFDQIKGDYPEFVRWGFRIFASRLDGKAEVVQDGDDLMYRVRTIDDNGLSTYILRCTHAADAVSEMEIALT